MGYISIHDRAQLRDIIRELKLAKTKATKADRWPHCHEVLNNIVVNSTLSVALDIKIWKLSYLILIGGNKRLLPR